METMEKNKTKLTTKDIITSVLLGVLANVLYFASALTLLLPPPLNALNIPLKIFLISFVFMAVCMKVPKTGSVLIFFTVIGIRAMYLPYFLALIVCGIIGEILVYGTRHFKMAFTVIAFLLYAAIGEILISSLYPMYLAIHSAEYSLEMMNGMTREQLQYWFTAPGLATMFLPGITGALIGGVLAYKVIQKRIDGNLNS